MEHLLVLEEKDKNGNVVKRTYYANTKPHPKHGGPDGVALTTDAALAYKFESKAYAENFQGGVEELKGYVARPAPSLFQLPTCSRG